MKFHKITDHKNKYNFRIKQSSSCRLRLRCRIVFHFVICVTLDFYTEHVSGTFLGYFDNHLQGHVNKNNRHITITFKKTLLLYHTTGFDI
jgi:hypothetical protein